MKICFIGSAESYHVERWLRYFYEKGYDTHCISTSPSSLPIKLHYIHDRYKMFGMRHAYYIKYYFSVKNILNKIKPDIIHGLQINYYSYMALMATSRPFVITPFGGDVLINPKNYVRYKQLASYCLKRSCAITTDADHLIDQLINLGADKNKIFKINFGTNVSQYKPLLKDYRLATQIGVENNTCIISMRHLMPVYNIETLIKSIPIVVRQCQNVIFIILSSGPLLGQLKSMARNLGIDKYIRWLGFVNGNDLPRVINLGDIYVSTSLSDAGLASSTAEAMACGLPVIVTDFGDNASWVKNDENGYLFPLKDYESLACYIIKLVNDPKRRKRMGMKNREAISCYNNWEIEMKKMEKIYNDIYWGNK